MNAIMFHYFHGSGHSRGQGSISADTLFEFIDRRNPENLLNPAEWIYKMKQNRLRSDEYSITFDDNLRCQTDVALPVLNAFGKAAFWFVYTSPYAGVIEKLELYRFFRTVQYDSIESFYGSFYKLATESKFADELAKGLRSFPESYLAQYGFYSREDRLFRFVRDSILGQNRYYELMDQMIHECGFELENISERLWVQEDDLKKLSESGHVIGLHSHTHPTRMTGLRAVDQEVEYATNKEILEGILNTTVSFMSHPCNSYNEDTLRILRRLDIQYGFRADSQLLDYTPLELPRVDHADIIKETNG